MSIHTRAARALLPLFLCAPLAAQGDDCSSAIPILGVGIFPFDTTGATTGGPNEPICFEAGSDVIEADIWFAWTAPTTDVYFAFTCGQTSVDTRLSVLSTPCGAAAIACDDDACGLQSQVSWNATAGTTYLIRLGNYPSALPGTGTFTIMAGGGFTAPAYRVSIDSHGPTIGAPDSAAAIKITAGDVLGSATGTLGLGPLATPNIDISAGPLGLNLATYPACAADPVPGALCPIEVDALSYGSDGALEQLAIDCGRIGLSVDEFAVGVADAYVPSLRSEGAVGALEASADCFLPRDLAAPPLAPAPGRNVGHVDGDGLLSTSGVTYPGIGLVEPDAPGAPPDPGDNVDALLFGVGASFPVYYSLDASYVDPATGAALNGSAAANGFLPGDVLVTPSAGGTPAVWATAAQLGLTATDDLDALALAESGDGIYKPSLVPHDWVGAAADRPDMLLFSLRRGSPTLGMIDSLFGLPIVEGDILTTPVVGGLSAFPGIYIAAENLGLVTDRSGATASDDLDGLYIRTDETLMIDCNGNGCEDALDISSGKSLDENDNGTPDECEKDLGLGYCQSTPNSTGFAALISAYGSTSVGANDLLLVGQPVPNQFGIFFYGASQGFAPLGNGILCIQAPLARLTPVLASGGVLIHALDNTSSQPGFAITPGSTWNFQGWFRDTAAGGSGFNLTDGLELTFTP